MSGEQQAIGSGVKVGHHQGNLIAGGPVVPNYDGMSVADANEAKQHYLTEQKKFRDGIWRERLQSGKGSSFDDNNDYSGNLTTTLCPMMQVMFSHLNIGQTFPDCAIITLRAAEEATYWGILFNTDKNDNNNMKMYCRGPESFLVYNTNSDTNGWTITRC